MPNFSLKGGVGSGEAAANPPAACSNTREALQSKCVRNTINGALLRVPHEGGGDLCRSVQTSAHETAQRTSVSTKMEDVDIAHRNLHLFSRLLIS